MLKALLLINTYNIAFIMVYRRHEHVFYKCLNYLFFFYLVSNIVSFLKDKLLYLKINIITFH